VNDKELVLTKEGLQKLEEELDELKTVHRREVNERIRQAKEFGDISENAEYEDAKQEQAFVEGRILKVESMIRNARIIDESSTRRRSASRRDRQGQRRQGRHLARVHDRRFDRSRSANGRLSNESPLGGADDGRKKGETVDVTTPRGVDEVQDRVDQQRPRKPAKKAS
jgi:transcription elongation factor GreA